MRSILKIFGTLFILMLLAIHLLIVSLFLIPVSRLSGLIMENKTEFLTTADIPQAVEDFLATHNISIKADYPASDNLIHQFLANILELRKTRFMNASQKLALNLNLLDFGEGIIGLHSASDYYYQKPLTELFSEEWITLINLQKIFSKK